MTSSSNIAHTYLSIFLIFIASNLIKINGKVCIIRRYLCHDKEAYIISWNFMLQLSWHPYYGTYKNDLQIIPIHEVTVIHPLQSSDNASKFMNPIHLYRSSVQLS